MYHYSGDSSDLYNPDKPISNLDSEVGFFLTSTTLGSCSNSPSALFVASDGASLRLYQAVIDARALLTESKPAPNEVS